MFADFTTYERKATSPILRFCHSRAYVDHTHTHTARSRLSLRAISRLLLLFRPHEPAERRGALSLVRAQEDSLLTAQRIRGVKRVTQPRVNPHPCSSG